MILTHNGKAPTIGKGTFVAPSANLLGDVQVGDCAAIWHGCNLRADLAPIIIGDHSNVQDGAVLHVSKGLPAVLGSHVTVGHGAIVHACTIGDNVLIGMNSVIMDGTKIGSNTIIAAMTVIGHFREYPDGVLIMGVPGKVVRPLTEKELANIRGYAERNYANARENYLDQEAEILERCLVRPVDVE